MISINRARRTVATALAAGLTAAAMGGPALANCYEDLGCSDSQYWSKASLRQLSCDALWTVRNFMYDEHGYCFQTAKAQAVFSNDDCYVTNASQIKFNIYEQTNIDRIVAVEREKGCR